MLRMTCESLVEILGRICAHPLKSESIGVWPTYAHGAAPKNLDDDEPEDEEDDERDLDPAVIREPDE